MSIWRTVEGRGLEQGDFLRGVFVPVLSDSYPESADGNYQADIVEHNVVILTQSCDLVNGKASQVLVCGAQTVREYKALATTNAAFWSDVKKRRREGYHLISPFADANPEDCILLSFRDLYTLPITILEKHAAGLGARYRLEPPYLEDMSQRFGLFFMRVALPTDLP